MISPQIALWALAICGVRHEAPLPPVGPPGGSTKQESDALADVLRDQAGNPPDGLDGPVHSGSGLATRYAFTKDAEHSRQGQIDPKALIPTAGSRRYRARLPGVGSSPRRNRLVTRESHGKYLDTLKPSGEWASMGGPLNSRARTGPLSADQDLGNTPARTGGRDRERSGQRRVEPKERGGLLGKRPGRDTSAQRRPLQLGPGNSRTREVQGSTLDGI